MMEDNELRVVLTAVVGAASAASASDACEQVLERLDARITTVVDCSDEEPGCWAVTIAHACPAEESALQESAPESSAVTLSSGVRRVLRALGLATRGVRVHCVPPTAWTVLEAPEQVTPLVPAGQRLLVEAHEGRMFAPVSRTTA